MEYTRAISNLRLADSVRAGGKGAALGELAHLGVKVPPGFVVLCDAFTEVLAPSHVRSEVADALHARTSPDMSTLSSLASRWQQTVRQLHIPEAIQEGVQASLDQLAGDIVAVRSSATAEDSTLATWAGQLESHLNVDRQELWSYIKQCWSSLFTPRALAYWAQRGGDINSMAVAVVVQAMIQAESAGVAFSIDPVGKQSDRLIIEAVFGLGEGLVSGQLTPDRYIVSKTVRRIIERSIAPKMRALKGAPAGGTEWVVVPPGLAAEPALTDTQILALAAEVMKIERHWQRPVDVEWVLAGGELNIVQCRPVTGVHV